VTASQTTTPAHAADADARSYLDQPGLRRPLALARERMERLGRTGGTVELEALSEEEASALGGLLGSLRRRRRPRAREPFVLALADLDTALRRSRFGLPLERALALVGPPLEPLPARRERERAAVEAFWREALAHPLCAREAAVGAWVDRLRATGALARMARSSPSGVSGSATQLPLMRALLGDALDLGTRLPAVPAIERGRLACQALGGDPHALDEGRPLAGLLLGQLAARAGVERPREARERRCLWERFGVLTDPVSADVLTLGLRPLPLCPLASALELMAGRHFRLTLGQLVAEPLRFETLDVVHVCENPAVVVAAEARLGAACAPLVCVGGWPSSAADALLTRLAGQGSELRYHGDFDWEGVRIAALVRRRYGAHPWRYDAASYRAALAAHAERVRPLDGRPPASGLDAELVAAMLACGGNLQEEAVLDDLVEDLAAPSNRLRPRSVAS
jgi:uncharacterized protein (TIGR02679 family)